MEKYLEYIVAAGLGLLVFHGGRALSRAQSNALNAKTLIDLTNQVQSMNDDLLALKNKVEAFEDKNRILWGYVYELIAYIKSKGHTPPEPPSELETNPKLLKILQAKQ